MKMAKASERDIDAAGEAMAVLNSIASGYYPSYSDDGEDDEPTFFDPDDPKHLRLFYDLMNKTLDDAPGWPGRVIGGMCYVILFAKNQIVDPNADCLELHPRFAAVAVQRDELLVALKDILQCSREQTSFGAAIRARAERNGFAVVAKAEGTTP